MDDIIVNIGNFQEYKRVYTWNFPVPSASFADFHCKYQINVAQELLDQQVKERGSIGYIMLQTEQLGFDEEVNIIVQPKVKGKVKFTDYREDQAPDIETKVYANVKFG